MKNTDEYSLIILKSIGEGVITTNNKGVITFMNESAEQLTGWNLSESINQPLEKIYNVTNEETGLRFENIVTRILREGKIIEFENNTLLETKDARKIIISNNGAPIRNNDEEIIGAVLVFRDLTEKKKAEAENADKNEQFKLLAENMSDMVALHNVKGEYLYVSPSCEKILGYKAEELAGISPYTIMHPDDLGQVINGIHKKTLKGNANRTSEYRLKHKNGEYIWVESTATPIFDEAEKDVLKIQSVTRVITERKKSEEELKQSGQRNRSLIENITDAIILINEQAEVIYQSPSTERITGFVLDDLNGKTVFDFIHPDDLQNSMGFFQNVLAEPGIPKHNAYRILHKLGHYIWIEGTIINLLHDESVRAFIVNYSDITERKKAEEQLTEYKHFFYNSNDLYCIANTDGYFEILNPNFSKHLGYTNDELTVNPFLTFVHPDDIDATLQEVEKLKTGALTINFVNRYKKKDGSYLWFDWSSTPDPVTGKLYAIARDITERKKTEQELILSEKKLKEAQSLAKVGSWELNLETGETLRSDELFKLLEIQKDDDTVGSALLLNFIHPDDKERITDNLSKVRTGIPIETERFRIITRNGTLKHVETRGRTEKNNKGEIIKLYGTVQDITETINLENEKNEIQERVMSRLEESVIERTQELFKANHLLELRNHEMTDSINYAKNIQRAILSKHEDSKKTFQIRLCCGCPKQL